MCPLGPLSAPMAVASWSIFKRKQRKKQKLYQQNHTFIRVAWVFKKNAYIHKISHHGELFINGYWLLILNLNTKCTKLPAMWSVCVCIVQLFDAQFQRHTHLCTYHILRLWNFILKKSITAGECLLKQNIKWIQEEMCLFLFASFGDQWVQLMVESLFDSPKLNVGHFVCYADQP